MPSTGFTIGREMIQEQNAAAAGRRQRQTEALRAELRDRGLDFDRVVDQLARFEVVVPSWNLSTGGTRFGRYPGPGEPRNLWEKLTDASQVHRLTGVAPRISLHIPWDKPEDPAEMLAFGRGLGISYDAVNSNTFQDQPGQKLSYKFGSLAAPDPKVREQAVAHNIDVIKTGAPLGSKALSVWIGDGGNHPGQMSLRGAFKDLLGSLQAIYAELPADWKMWIEYKFYEPAFYSTVINDWGTAYMLCERLGPKASVLVDLGHHAPNTNIEMIVARLIEAGRLGGFHFNDSKYGDDDLTSGSIKPYQLFLIFCELVEAGLDASVKDFKPGYMIDQSHNIKDPLEDMLQTVDQLQQAHAKACLVNRAVLAEHQRANRVIDAELVLQDAFATDVRPLVQAARVKLGAAADPLGVFRASQYRRHKTAERT